MSLDEIQALASSSLRDVDDDDDLDDEDIDDEDLLVWSNRMFFIIVITWANIMNGLGALEAFSTVLTLLIHIS